MTSDSDALLIGINDVKVGVLERRGADCSFRLLDEYLELPRRPILGQLFEENRLKRWQQHQRLIPWFSNLLPEGAMLRFVADALELSEQSEFKLFQHFLHDLPGAVTAGPIDTDELLLGRHSTVDESESDRLPFRSSLAGVELKLSVVNTEGNLTLPGAGLFGDTILKFASSSMPGVPANEFVTMSLARLVGIDVASVRLVNPDDLGPLPSKFDTLLSEPAIAIDRFDRVDAAGRRTHMEDLNQVIGNWPNRKYERATFERVGLLIRSLCGATDFREYVRRLAFSIAIGNEDMHLKNWSIWYPDGYTARLSPAYDLVSTVQFEDLTRGTALKLGGSRKFRYISDETFSRLGAKCGHDPHETLEVAKTAVRELWSVWGEACERLSIDSKYQSRIVEHQDESPFLVGLLRESGQ